MNTPTPLPQEQLARAKWLADCGGVEAAIEQGLLDEVVNLPLTEALVLGLLRQGVSKYLMILGHGSTELGETLRAYEAAGLVRGFQCRNEVEMAHAGTALSWVYGEVCAVVTSIGPGALQALAGSLAANSNGVGLYHIYGDETTYGEGYNMQQIPKPVQGLWGQLTQTMGASYTVYEPHSLRDALRRGVNTVFHPTKAGCFYLNLPLNVQPREVAVRLSALPQLPARNGGGELSTLSVLPAHELIKQACQFIANTERVVIKLGGGARYAARLIREFTEAVGAVVVASPGSTGILPDAHPQYMHVGGSKGSLSGNFAMQGAELVIFIGSRAVCQSDCSGTGWPNAKQVININPDSHDVQHYNQTLALQGDAESILPALIEQYRPGCDKHPWLAACAEQKRQWLAFKAERTAASPLFDEIWQQAVLTQPAAIAIADEFAREQQAVKFFDAGDVQANGFQVVADDTPFETFTESGASYMGFAVSALLSGAMADEGRYGIAFTGDGSFMMNPQILIDGVLHGVHGTILLLDNRRMAAISQLQLAQYQKEYRTADFVEVDYVQMAQSVTGVQAIAGGATAHSLRDALARAYQHSGLSLVHVPVYYGDDPLGGMGAYGSWNVGNWCEDVQSRYLEHLI